MTIADALVALGFLAVVAKFMLIEKPGFWLLPAGLGAIMAGTMGWTFGCSDLAIFTLFLSNTSLVASLAIRRSAETGSSTRIPSNSIIGSSAELIDDIKGGERGRIRFSGFIWIGELHGPSRVAGEKVSITALTDNICIIE